MRVRRLSLLISALALVAASAAHAARHQDPRLGQMEEIFFLSGLETQLGDFEQGMDEGLASQMTALPDSQIAILRRAAARSFSADAMRKSVRTGLLERYDERGAAGTLAWLRSPLGRKITRMEVASSAGSSPEALERYARSLAGTPPSPSRMALVQALQEATGGAEFGVDMALAAAHGVASAANATQPAGQRAPEAAIAAAIEAQRPALRRELEALMQVSALYTYRDLSDAELTRYVDFARSDAGRWYHDAVVQELARTIRGAAAGLGAVVAQELSAENAGAASIAH